MSVTFCPDEPSTLKTQTYSRVINRKLKEQSNQWILCSIIPIFYEGNGTNEMFQLCSPTYCYIQLGLVIRWGWVIEFGLCFIKLRCTGRITGTLDEIESMNESKHNGQEEIFTFHSDYMSERFIEDSKNKQKRVPNKKKVWPRVTNTISCEYLIDFNHVPPLSWSVMVIWIELWSKYCPICICSFKRFQ